jgi:hypothetical protein
MSTSRFTARLFHRCVAGKLLARVCEEGNAAGIGHGRSWSILDIAAQPLQIINTARQSPTWKKVDEAFWEKFQVGSAGNEMG